MPEPLARRKRREPIEARDQPADEVLFLEVQLSFYDGSTLDQRSAA
jgi:hypothetical protein